MRLFVSSLFIIILIVSVNAKVWNVNVDCISDTITNGDSENIDVAFAYATSGDVIIIDSGVYYYSVQNTIDTDQWYFLKIVDNDVRIEANGDVVIDGENQIFILYGATADSIYIEGITFRNAYDYTEGDVNQYGVVMDLYSGDSWTIKNNVFYNNTVEDSLVEGRAIRGGIIYIERWSVFENNIFDSNAIYDYGYGDTIHGFVYCYYQVDFVGNEFKNNIIENRSEKQKTICGAVYYETGFRQSYWFDNTFQNNVMLNYNPLSGAVAIIYQDNYQNITDAVYGDSNAVINTYYYDYLTYNIDDTDILVVPSLLKADVLIIENFDNYPYSHNKIKNLALNLFSNDHYSHNKVNWLAIDLYDLLPYIPEEVFKNFYYHILLRRRFK